MVTCLFAENGIDLRAPLRDGASNLEIMSIIQGTWSLREDRYSEERTNMTDTRQKVEMYHIGG
jgi:cyclic pyranopterin phosphate synthase